MNRSSCPVELCACDVNGAKGMEKMPLTKNVSSRFAFKFNQSTLSHGPCAIASCKSPTCSCVWLFANKFSAGLVRILLFEYTHLSVQAPSVTRIVLFFACAFST